MHSPLSDPTHRKALVQDALTQLEFFRASLNAQGGFDQLDHAGKPIPDAPQELHCTTRLVHSYAMGHVWGAPDCAGMIDAGMACLWARHRDAQAGGYVWALMPGAGVTDGTKLAYGHVFVLLAAASAMGAGHDGAARLLANVEAVIDRHFWDEDAGLLRDEFTQDWQPFSTYRGMNANMHGIEAMLAAFEATDRAIWLDRAGRILEFFTATIAPAHGWRIPEHYTESWQVDHSYRGNPVFRPPGTTPGHSLEFARLILQHWDLSGRPATDAPARARALVETALADAWLPEGGLAYTLHPNGAIDRATRYWWPVTEGLGALAALIKLDPRPGYAEWYLRLRATAERLFIDKARGGWFPEVDAQGQPAEQQFTGKPDIYHSLQADLLPLVPGISRTMAQLSALRE
jgi:mannose/cellobiose epimerase-like protein (N-acyl-D-glucosamine 2-epimerase family)